jgi:hypothetical protein
MNLPIIKNNLKRNKMNARKEFLEHIQKDNSGVLCAHIKFDDGKSYFITTGYTKDEWDQFLSDIDRVYDDGYGGQELFGTIWFNSGYWSTRDEYDGSEWWRYNKVPEIPDNLNRVDKVRDIKIDSILK